MGIENNPNCFYQSVCSTGVDQVGVTIVQGTTMDK